MDDEDEKKGKFQETARKSANYIAGLAKMILLEVFGPFLRDANDAMVETAHDMLRDAIGGKLTFDEFAQAVSKDVDRTKLRVERNENLRYVGGILKFAPSKSVGLEFLVVSFQLYFIDEEKIWHMTSAQSEVPAAKFSQVCLDELCAKGEIVYEVE